MSPFYWAAAAVFVALSLLDLLQTLQLQKLGAIEQNPLLGAHPKPGVLIAFAIVTTAAWIWFALWLAYKGAPGIAAVFALGIFLRLWTVVKGRKLKATLKRRQ